MDCLSHPSGIRRVFTRGRGRKNRSLERWDVIGLDLAWLALKMEAGGPEPGKADGLWKLEKSRIGCPLPFLGRSPTRVTPADLETLVRRLTNSTVRMHICAVWSHYFCCCGSNRKQIHTVI